MDKESFCSAAYYCLTVNVTQQATCKYFADSEIPGYKYCGWFSIAKCCCMQARKEARLKKERSERADRIIEFVRKNP
jgi:hypothetical protein